MRPGHQRLAQKPQWCSSAKLVAVVGLGWDKSLILLGGPGVGRPPRLRSASGGGAEGGEAGPVSLHRHRESLLGGGQGGGQGRFGQPEQVLQFGGVVGPVREAHRRQEDLRSMLVGELVGIGRHVSRREPVHGPRAAGPQPVRDGRAVSKVRARIGAERVPGHDRSGGGGVGAERGGDGQWVGCRAHRRSGQVPEGHEEPPLVAGRTVDEGHPVELPPGQRCRDRLGQHPSVDVGQVALDPEVLLGEQLCHRQLAQAGRGLVRTAHGGGVGRPGRVGACL